MAKEKLSGAEQVVTWMNQAELGVFNFTKPLRDRIDTMRDNIQTNPNKYNETLPKEDQLTEKQIKGYQAWAKTRSYGIFRKRETLEDFMKQPNNNLSNKQKEALKSFDKEQSKWTNKTKGAFLQIPVQAGNLVGKTAAIVWDTVKLAPIAVGMMQGSKSLTMDYAKQTLQDMKTNLYQATIGAIVTGGTIATFSPFSPAIAAGTTAVAGVGSATLGAVHVAASATVVGDAALAVGVVKKGAFIAGEEYKYDLETMKKKDPILFQKYQDLQALKADPDYQDIDKRRQILATEKWLINEYAHKQNKIITMPFGGSKGLKELQDISQENRTSSQAARIEKLTAVHKAADDRISALRCSLGSEKGVSHDTSTIQGSISAVRQKRDFKDISFNR